MTFLQGPLSSTRDGAIKSGTYRTPSWETEAVVGWAEGSPLR